MWLAAANVLLGVLVYLGLGLWAALGQDGLSAQARAGLGVEAPLGLRAFHAAQATWPRLSPLPFLIALALVGLRRLVRRGSAVGEHWLFDLALFPIGAGLLVGAVVAVLVWQGDGPAARSRALEGLAFYGALTAAGLAVVGLLAALLARSRASRLALAACVVLVLLARAGADAWGAAHLAAFDRRLAEDVAADRARAAAARRPVLRGEPRPENAAVQYRAALAGLAARAGSGARDAMRSLDEVARSAPGSPVPESARALIEQHRDTTAAVREALQAERCDWETPYGEVYWRDGALNLALPRLVGVALVVEGHELASRGDLGAAAGRYMDAVQFGSDYGSGHLLIGALVGSGVEATALRALGRLVTGRGPGSPPLAEIDRDLARLEPALASVSVGYRNERLSLGRFERRLEEAPAEAGLQEPLILPWLVPYRALAAHALAAFEPRLRDLERALAAEDPRLVGGVYDRIEADFTGAKNPILRDMAGVGGPFRGQARRARWAEDEARALLRLTRLAVRVEGARDASGRYPPDVSGLEVPVDPYGWPARLLYAPSPDRRGYKVWSVGPNGTDDGGSDEKLADVVLERRVG